MDLSLNQIVSTIIFVSFGMVGFFSLVSRILHHRAETKLTQLRIVCRLCGCVFIAEHPGKMIHCESCGKLNLHKGNGTLG